MNTGDALFIGYDFSHGKDMTTLTVARQIKGKIEIINVHQGEEAYNLYQKFISEINSG